VRREKTIARINSIDPGQGVEQILPRMACVGVADALDRNHQDLQVFLLCGLLLEHNG
jgi:hypothetical protein